MVTRAWVTVPQRSRRAGDEGAGDSGDPVEVAAAGLAVDEGVLLAQLLEPLGGDGHPAAAAEVGLGHLDGGDPAVAEDAVVVGEDAGGELHAQRAPIAPHRSQLGLDGAKPLAERGLLPAAVRLALAKAPLRLLELGGEALLGLHGDEDVLLDPRLLLLDLLDLHEDGGVLLVGLDLVELALELLALDAVVLEVLLLGAL